MKQKWHDVFQQSINLQAMTGILLMIILLIPAIAVWLESVMLTHMLVQLPLIMLSGWLVGGWLIQKYRCFFGLWNGNGVPGILLFIMITTYWMLPRALDEALTIWQVELFKYISLTLLAGIPLRDSWHKLKSVGKGFVILNYLPMFAFMGWLYLDSPLQLCNNYLEIEQRSVGIGFLAAAVCMLLYILHHAFTDRPASS